MRKIVAYLAIFALLTSCGSDSETVVTPNPIDTSGAIHTNYTVDPDSELVAQDEAFLEILNSFPKDWVQVEVKKDKKVYTERCDIGTPALQIQRVENHWEILTTYGHDAESWHIINMTANLNSFNEQELQEGIFVVEKLTYPDDEFYEVSYFWNKTAGFCTFGDFFSAEAKFAEKSKMNEFEIVKEPCL